MKTQFFDRSEAGKFLAENLSFYVDRDDVLGSRAPARWCAGRSRSCKDAESASRSHNYARFGQEKAIHAERGSPHTLILS